MSERNNLKRRKSAKTIFEITGESLIGYDDSDRYSKRWLYEFQDGRTFTLYAQNPPKLVGVSGVYEVFAAGWFDRKKNVIIGAYDLCDFENPNQFQDGRKATQ